MARSLKMETCPTCGATIAKNLADRIRKNEEGYICPGTSTETSMYQKKAHEKSWEKDVEDSTVAYLDSVNPNLSNA